MGYRGCGALRNFHLVFPLWVVPVAFAGRMRAMKHSHGRVFKMIPTNFRANAE